MERKAFASVMLLAPAVTMGFLSLAMPQLVILVFFLSGSSLAISAALGLIIFVLTGNVTVAG